jgi:hypothetical protein
MNMATHIKHALIIDIEKRYICVVYTLLCYVMIECLFFVHSFDINFIHFMLFLNVGTEIVIMILLIFCLLF